MSARGARIGSADTPVTVVIPCYCCADTLERAVRSILWQSRRPRQIVLVEDGSPDGGATRRTIEHIQGSAGTIDVTTVWLDRNRGPGHARNAGWAAATQPYLAFLDADDAWHPKKLELQLDWMRRHPEAAVSGTFTRYIGRVDSIPETNCTWRIRELRVAGMLLSNPFATSSVVLRADIEDRFASDKRYAEDYLLWVSMATAGARAFLLEMPLTYLFKRTFGESGLSSHLWEMHGGIRDCYRRLRRDGRIGPMTHVLLDAIAWAKLSRQAVLTSLWRMTSCGNT